MGRNAVLTRHPSGTAARDTERLETWGGSGSGLPAGTALNRSLDRLQNTIPGGIITFWAGIQGTITLSANSVPDVVFWLLFGFSIVATPVYVYVTIETEAVDTSFGVLNVVSQSLLATGAFVVWVYYLGGPFCTAGLYSELYATILVFVYPVMVVVLPFYLTVVLWVATKLLRRIGALGGR
jgi:hypothetical protein